MEKIKSILFIYSVLFLGISSTWARVGVEIEYSPIKMIRNSSNLPLEITVSNFSGVPVREVQVWHRWAGESQFKMLRMENKGFNYFASLDVANNKSGLVEYYFAINYIDNRSETYPSDAPSQLVLRTAVQVPRNYGNDILIISPEPEEQIFDTDIIITASFASFASMVDVERTRLYLNTWDVTNYLQKYNEFISFAPRTVPAGKHKIRLELYNDQGNLVASREWNFTALSGRGPQVIEEGVRVTGRVFAELRQEELGVDGMKNDYNQTGLQLRGAYQNWNFGGRVYVSNQEKSYRQPVNRYSAFAKANFWNDRYFKVDFGDNYPKMNPLIMQNIFLRGSYAKLYLKEFNIDFAMGTTRRAVEGEAVEDTIKAYGTFERKITTIRPSFGSGENFQLGFTYLKGKDDEGSIDFGINPQENAAIGTDLFFGLDQKRIIFEGSFGASAYNRNIAGGSIPFDSLEAVFAGIGEGDRKYYDFANNFITINQYLILRPGMAYQAGVRLRYYQNNLSFIYESVDEDYYSLGQPFLLRDNRGFRIVDNISLVQNQLFLVLGYRRYKNNLQNIKSSTTTNNTFFANLSYFPLGNYPEVTIGFNNYSRENDLPADSIGSILNRPEDNNSTTLNFSGGYRFPVGDTRNRIGIDLVSYRRDDIFKNAESNSNYITINLRTQFRFPLQTVLEFITQKTETGLDTDLGSELDLTTFGVGGKYIFSNIFTADRLSLGATLRFGNVKSEYKLATLDKYEYSRNYYSLRINYAMINYGSIGLIGDYLSYGGDRGYSDFIYTLRYDYGF